MRTEFTVLNPHGDADPSRTAAKLSLTAWRDLSIIGNAARSTVAIAPMSVN